jgi:hypothetical protein
MTAILTQRCDPFGMEIERYAEKLAGGMYGEKYAGKYKWHCEEPAIGRYRFICRGGNYGFRRQADGGLIEAYHCDGGHKGQVMVLCRIHVRDFTQGPPKPGWSKDKRTPHGVVGGTKANEMCPRCMWPPEAAELQQTADALQQQMAQMQIYGLIGQFAKLQAEQDQVRARLDELNETGRVHKCPLQLVEVS